MISKPRCVLFDLDGTLVDTAPDLGFAANAVREGLGLPPLEMERYRPSASGGARGLLKVALGIDDSHPDFAARRDQFLSVYRQNLSRNSRLFDGVAGMLQELEQSNVTWGIVTNKPDWLAQPLLEDLGLASRAACAIGAQDGFDPKPAPDLLLHACELVQTKPGSTIYVGDDRRDVHAAHAARMPAVVAAWGYIVAEEDVTDWEADAIIDSPMHLMSLWA